MQRNVFMGNQLWPFVFCLLLVRPRESVMLEHAGKTLGLQGWQTQRWVEKTSHRY